MDIGIIAFLVTLTILSFGLRRKNRSIEAKAVSKDLPTPAGKTAAERERKRQGDEELITVILPTISNDGK